MLRYSKLSDAQVLAKVLEVCKAENISYSDDGLEAVVFTAQVYVKHWSHYHYCPINNLHYLPG